MRFRKENWKLHDSKKRSSCAEKQENNLFFTDLTFLLLNDELLVNLLPPTFLKTGLSYS